MHKQKRRRDKVSIHHLIPRSRCKEMQLNPHDHRNKVAISDELHRHWHKLWDNRTPTEVVIILYDRLKAGEHFYPDNLNFFAVYGTLSIISAIRQTWTNWFPTQDYYRPNLPHHITRLLGPARLHNVPQALNA